MIRKTPLASAIGAIAMASSFSVLAQSEIDSETVESSAQAQAVSEVEEVIVTGSRIARAVSYTHLTLPTIA